MLVFQKETPPHPLPSFFPSLILTSKKTGFIPFLSLCIPPDCISILSAD